MIQQVTDPAARAAADKPKQRRQQLTFLELNRSNIKNAAQHLERAYNLPGSAGFTRQCLEMAEKINAVRKRLGQAEGVELYHKGQVINSPWATQNKGAAR